MAKLFDVANSVDFVAYTSAFLSFNWQKIEGSQKTLCPFHGDTHPTFTFWRAKNKATCFACGESLSLVDTVAKYYIIEAYKAAQLICEDMNLPYDELKKENPNQSEMA